MSLLEPHQGEAVEQTTRRGETEQFVMAKLNAEEGRVEIARSQSAALGRSPASRKPAQCSVVEQGHITIEYCACSFRGKRPLRVRFPVKKNDKCI